MKKWTIGCDELDEYAKIFLTEIIRTYSPNDLSNDNIVRHASLLAIKAAKIAIETRNDFIDSGNTQQTNLSGL